MKRLVTYILHYFPIIFLLIIAAQPAKASHLLGGELSYKYVSASGINETYIVTLTLFADCSAAGPGSAYDALITDQPLINVYKDNVLSTSTRLLIDLSQSDIEITPVCPKDKDSTKCTSLSNSIPGIKKFIYTGPMVIAGTSTNWRFAAEGDLGNNTAAGRTGIIGNIQANSTMYLEAILNNVPGPNSSTIYTSEPTPFFCINRPQQYNIGAVDPDADSLSYSLIPAKNGPTVDAIYYPPYTGANPLPSASGTFNFDAKTGQLTFTPDVIINSVVVNRVTEYRNGVMVGSNMREMTFIVIPTCHDDAPTPGAIKGLSTGSLLTDNAVEVCQGITKLLAFDLKPIDLNGYHITASTSGVPAGATLQIDSNGSLAPTIHFSWDVSKLVMGDYNFYLTLKDDGCPLSSSQTFAYTVKIGPFPGSLTTGAKDGCEYSLTGQAWIMPTVVDTNTYTFTWQDAMKNFLHVQPESKKGDTLSNIGPGTYEVHVQSLEGCFTDVYLTVATPLQCDCNVFLPDAFTPNADGKNDNFGPIDEQRGPGIDFQLSQLTIVDRYGQEVFSTNSKSKKWDGTFNGKPVEMGTYFYYLQGTCNNGHKIEKKGNVIVVR